MFFAKLDENNVVLQVIEAEQSFVDSQGGSWQVTDINGVTPKNYAGIGYTWMPDIQAFMPPKPFASWTIVDGTWTPPVAYPDPIPGEKHDYNWNEGTQSWDPA